MEIISKLLALLMAFITAMIPVEPTRIDVAPYNFKWVKNDKEFKVMAERISSEKNNKNLDVSAIMKDFNDVDGSFKSIDYNSPKKDTWHPIIHLQNLLKLQIASHTPGNKFYKNATIKKQVLKGVKYWAEKKYFCEWNGWFNDIGISLYLPDILLYGVDGLDSETSKGLLEGMKSKDLYHKGLPSDTKERKVDSTGGNLTDEAISMLKIAVIEKDGNTIMWLTSLLEREVQTFPTYKEPMNRSDCDGIKEDMSFLQHWHLVYFGGYGEVFVDGMNRYIKYTRDTQYALSTKALNNYANFIIDGMQYATRNGYRDISASGRGVVRVDALKGIFNEVKTATNLLLSFNGISRKAELQAMVKNRFSGKDLGVGKAKFFYESDYGVYNDAKYMATVRHASDRTRIFEVLNDENPLGHYTGYGATFYYLNGNEYYNLLPLYNWNKIPGTTTRQGFLPQPNQIDSYNEKGNTNLTAGVSNGKVLASYIALNKNGVKSNQGYFMFKDGVVCLGNNINSSTLDEIVTSINQTKLGSAVTAGYNGKRFTMKKGAKYSAKYDYINNNGISYISDNTLNVISEHKKGDWKTVNTRMDSKPLSGDLFTVDISHGKMPFNSTYDYTVLMNATPSSTEKYLKNPTLVTVANNKKVQAVYDKTNRVFQAIFYKPAFVKLPNGRNIEVKSPCLCIMEEINGDTILTVTSPDFETRNIEVIVNGTSKNIKIAKNPLRYNFQ